MTREQRKEAFGFTGATVLFTGLSASGKSTIASGVEEAFIRAGRPAFLLDGDNLRHGLSGDLGFSETDRHESLRRAGHVASMFAESGALALLALISPYERDRCMIRTMHDDLRLPYAEVFLNTPLEVCEQRDPKGLYARARAGELSAFTGIDSAYERPTAAELVLEPGSGSIAEQVAKVIDLVHALSM
jgi:adenylyl-sulfate kinase